MPFYTLRNLLDSNGVKSKWSGDRDSTVLRKIYIILKIKPIFDHNVKFWMIVFFRIDTNLDFVEKTTNM